MSPRNEEENPQHRRETEPLSYKRGAPGPASNAEGRGGDETTSSFVEREAKRRRRLLRFYLALLAVPVILGVALLIFGRSDRREIMDEIRKQAPPIVRSEIKEQVKPAIQSEVQTQVSSRLGEIGELKARQELLSSEVNQLKSSNASLSPEDVAMIKQSILTLNQKEAEIKRLVNRVEVLEGRLKFQKP